MAKIIQIATRFDEVIGLDERGVLWTLSHADGNQWLHIANSPDEEE